MVRVSSRLCSSAIALSWRTSWWVDWSVWRRSAMPPRLTISTWIVRATSSTRCEIVSARAVSASIPGLGGAAGTVSPASKNAVRLGRAGQSWISWSPKKPTASTRAVEFSGTWYLLWMLIVTTIVPRGSSSARDTTPTCTPASRTGCPSLRPEPQGKRA